MLFKAYLKQMRAIPLTRLNLGPGPLKGIKSLQPFYCQALILQSKVCSVQAQMAHNKSNE